MGHHDCDVAVIGAGTAGLAAERKARQEGARTLLIDPVFAGTTCATVGCMPSKLLIAAADAAQATVTAGAFGIRSDAHVDGPAVFRRLRQMRDDFAGGVRDAIGKLPEGTTLKGRARFVAPNELETDAGDRITARAVIVATGSAPTIPGPYRDLGDILLTNESVFELDDLPESLGVIGAGPIGIELAQAMARLGVRVEVFDLGDSVAGLPVETSVRLRGLLEREFPVHLGVKPEARRDGDGVEVRIEGHSARFQRLLIATGRPPTLDGLGLENAGVDMDGDGHLEVDPCTLQSGDGPVFVAGDANGSRPLLHEASDEGTIAGHNAAHWPDLRRSERKVPLAITFTRPNAAVIGRLPGEDDDLLTGCGDFDAQGRARVEDRPGGLLRLHGERETARIVGADLCVPGGEHLAHLLAWIIQRGITAVEMQDLPFYHPTLEEGMKGACRDLCQKLRTTPGWDADRGTPPGG